MPSDIDNGAVEALEIQKETTRREVKWLEPSPVGWQFSLPLPNGLPTSYTQLSQSAPAMVRNSLRAGSALLINTFPIGRSASDKATKPRSTAYFDGMRGIGSLLVYHFHHLKWAYEKDPALWAFEQGFGWKGHYYLSCFPGLRLLFTGGDCAVVMFYIFAGFVLAGPLLRCVNSGDYAALSSRLVSSIFRRWFRLFLPVFAVSFIWMTSWHMFGIQDGQKTLVPCDTYGQEVWRWIHESYLYSGLDNSRVYFKYLSFAWFIPTQFRASCMLFLATLAVARSPPGKRLFMMALLTVYFVYVLDVWYLGATTIGFLIADFQLLHANDSLPPILKALDPKKPWISYAVFALGVWLASCPNWGTTPEALSKQPGWYYWSYLAPARIKDTRWYVITMGTTLLIVSIPRVAPVRSFLEGPVCQRLGKISFMIYLVHGPLLWSIGDRLYAAMGRPRNAHAELIPNYIDRFHLPSWGPAGLQVNYIVPQLIMLLLSVWVAGIAQIVIEEPIGNFTDHLFKWATSKSWKF